MLFIKVKKLFAKEPVLRIYDLSLPIKVKTDVSDFALRVYLVQQYPNGWHPVTYYS